MENKIEDRILKYRELEKVMSRFFQRRGDIESIEDKRQKYANSVELSDLSYYASYNRTRHVNLNREQSERLGVFVKEMLKEELEEIKQEIESIDIITEKSDKGLDLSCLD